MPEHKYSYADIVFPVNLDRLTYRIPHQLNAQCLTGTVVEAPIRGRRNLGILIERYDSVPSCMINKKISDISSVREMFSLSTSSLDLVKWVAEYYMCTEGLALKSLIFSDVFNPPKRKRKITEQGPSNVPFDVPETNDDIAAILGAAGKGYRTILYHASSLSSEISLITSLLELDSAIVIVPEKYDLSFFLPYLKASERNDHCVIHGGMSRSALADAYDGMSSGRYRIVLGTMQAVSAPIKDPQIIIVFKEHSSFYKHEETPSYNARDVAVKRGTFEDTTVLLTSMTPSFESFYNSDKGKYELISGSSQKFRPETRIINAAGSKTILTSPLENDILDTLDRRGSTLLILNRKGHSILQCNECGHIETCPRCDIPYVYHSSLELKCHYCGGSITADGNCGNCNGTNIKSIGSGTEMVAELLEDRTGISPVLIDSDHKGGVPDESIDGKIVLGTDLALRVIGPEYNFDIIAMLNADIASLVPDFRSYEKLFQRITYLSQRAKKGSRLYVQTYNWRDPFFKFVKEHDYNGLYAKELPKRIDFNYPPACKLAILSINKASFKNGRSLTRAGKGIEILGPIEKRVGRKDIIEILIKYDAGITIQKYISSIREHISSNKKDLKIDIDPLML
ncbi:MAG: hypothetical protein JSV21_10105 [Nitrospirota bacterium]|nr:MAG: hypothetical protein JSV21_10105 [Nitrospirota bacterium]